MWSCDIIIICLNTCKGLQFCVLFKVYDWQPMPSWSSSREKEIVIHGAQIPGILHLKASWRLHPFDKVFFEGKQFEDETSLLGNFGESENTRAWAQQHTQTFLQTNSNTSMTFPIRHSSWKVHENIGVLLQNMQSGQVWGSVTKVLPSLVTTSQSDISKCAFPWKNEGSA